MTEEASARIVVLGVGEPGRRDLGVGLVAAEALRHEALGANVTVQTAHPGLDMLLALQACDLAVVICAAQMGESPGTVRSFWAQDAEAELITPLPGTGGTNLTDWLELGGLANGSVRVRLIGIEPAEIAPGTGLTPEVGQAIAAALDDVRRQLG